MLAKLLKYEFKATSRTFIPLYIVLLVFAVINRIITPEKILISSNSFIIKDILAVVGITLYIGLILAVVVVTLIIMIQRFYKNLLGNEGYLMFTLPVQSWKLIASKVITSLTWSVLSFFITITSLVIVIGPKNIVSGIRDMLAFIQKSMGGAGFVILPIYGLLAVVSSILTVFTAIALGQLFSRHRVIASFGMYCAIYAVYQLLMLLYMLLVGNNIAPTFLKGTPSIWDLNLFSLLFILFECVRISINFVITNKILKNKLNLE